MATWIPQPVPQKRQTPRSQRQSSGWSAPSADSGNPAAPTAAVVNPAFSSSRRVSFQLMALSTVAPRRILTLPILRQDRRLRMMQMWINGAFALRPSDHGHTGMLNADTIRLDGVIRRAPR